MDDEHMHGENDGDELDDNDDLIHNNEQSWRASFYFLSSRADTSIATMQHGGSCLKGMLVVDEDLEL
jgi:hypothetical protein